VLYAKTALLEDMAPFLGGGEMVQEVFADHFTWKEPPWKFEAGTPNFADVAAFSLALDYLRGLGMERVRQHEIEVTRYALQAMRELGEGVRIFGPQDLSQRGGVVSFTLEGVHPHDIAQVLDWEAVCIRAGHHCAQPLMRHLGVAATARASFYVYNVQEEVDIFVHALKKASELFGHA
ncbi:MAG: aminotransferase class V-fold PLP-dependent enzyme, partial [Chloroflexi bacterium]|nr:aminotransferase class V-fold PLP-dependent enzyme [Chloroflexota bacterium]